MPSRVPGSCEEPRERVAALGRDGHRARAPHAKDPAVLEVHLEERRAERAADVRPPLREVDAGARESAPLVESRLDVDAERRQPRSEEHTSELQSRFGISYAVFCLKKK